MRLIPDLLLESKSSAESKVFATLARSKLAGDWVAMHSVNCSAHEYKHWCEIDFLLIGPPGMFVLEVKGGRITLEDGIWRYRDRFGVDHKSSEGPFVQARGAMYALRGLLADRYRIPDLDAHQLTFGFGVAFPDGTWTVDTPEMPRVLVADASVVSDATAFDEYLVRLTAYWKSKFPRGRKLSAADVSELRRRIRPDVDVYPSFSTRIGLALRQMQTLTEEQYRVLDVIEANDRVIVTGGAGTGKTYLMIQCARRARANLKTALVVTESPVLAAQIRMMEPDRSICVTDIAALEDIASVYDILFVDEGQDMLDMGYLDRLSKRVVGGLERGCWRWFMDPNNQAHVAGRFDRDALTYLTDSLPTGRPVMLPLTRNVRNTREIIARVHAWTGAEIGNAQWTGHGLPPRVVVYESEQDLAGKLGEVIEELTAKDIPLEHIGIVLGGGFDAGFLEQIAPFLRSKIVPLTPATVRAQLAGRIVLGSAAAFKGLERPAVLLVGFAGRGCIAERVSEFYVAATRANYALVVFADRELGKELKSVAPEVLR